MVELALKRMKEKARGAVGFFRDSDKNPSRARELLVRKQEGAKAWLWRRNPKNKGLLKKANSIIERAGEAKTREELHLLDSEFFALINENRIPDNVCVEVALALGNNPHSAEFPDPERRIEKLILAIGERILQK